MKARAKVTAHLVRHRIDGLEITLHLLRKYRRVRHRIDGLEMVSSLELIPVLVRHRIDGLEK